MTRAKRTRPDQIALFIANHRRNCDLYDNRSGARRRAIDGTPVTPIPLAVGQRVKFLNDRRWWTTQAITPRHVVLTRTGDFGGDPLYAVISWEQGRRGPHDNSWGLDTITREDCEVVAAAMDAGEIHLSERHSIYLDIEAIA